MADTNRGFIVSGGTIKADQIVGGENAKGYKYEGSKASQADLQHIYTKLDELEKEMQGHGAELRQPEDLISAAKTVKAELASEKPNKLTVMSILSPLCEA